MKRTDISVRARPDKEDVLHIMAGLRDIDRKEFAAAGATLEDALHVGTQKDALLFSLRGEPVFVWGAYGTKGHVHLWGFGTDNTTRVIPAVTHFVKTWWLPNFFGKDEGRRIEVRVPLSSQHSISWLLKFGMTVESWNILGATVTGEPSVQLAYTTREYERDYVHLREVQAGVNSGTDASAN
jgi:hypothetical protein